MRARTLGAAALAVFAAPAAARAEQVASQVVACAAPTLLECSILAPGFNRWFLAPLGIAPSDAEMAEEVCRNGKGWRVASTRRLPVRRGLLNNTRVVQVTCAVPPAQPRVVARSPVLPEAGPAPVLAGSPQDFAPQPEGRRASRAEAETDWRAERRARRLEARDEAEARPRRPSRSSERDRRSVRVLDETRARPAARPAPVVETRPPPARVEPAPKPAAADLKRAAEPTPAVSAPKPVAEERKPADADRPAEKPVAPPKAKQDPSISYEHF